MEIKKSIVIALANLLSGIKLNKLSDKEVKVAFIKNHLALRKASLSIIDDKDEIIRKFQEDWRDELTEVINLRKDSKPVEGHDAFLKAEAEADEALVNLLNDNIDIEVESVELNKFVESFSEEDITLDQIALLMDVGILE